MKTFLTIITMLSCLSSSALQIVTENWDDYVLQFRVTGLNTIGDDSVSDSFTENIFGQSYSVEFSRSGTDTSFHVFWNPPGVGQNVDDYFTWTYPVVSLPVGFAGTSTLDRSWQMGGSVLITYHNIFPEDDQGGGGGGDQGGNEALDDNGSVLICFMASVLATAFVRSKAKTSQSM